VFRKNPDSRSVRNTILPGVFGRGFYLPRQNRLKIVSSKSFVVFSPVISPRVPIQSDRSKAMISIGAPVRVASAAAARDREALSSALMCLALTAACEQSDPESDSATIRRMADLRFSIPAPVRAEIDTLMISG
jgi:hypothetical protein